MFYNICRSGTVNLHMNSQLLDIVTPYSLVRRPNPTTREVRCIRILWYNVYLYFLPETECKISQEIETHNSGKISTCSGGPFIN